MFKPKEKYKVAYHYTGLEGFLGITESRSFWLTNAYYLNDKNEIKWPIEMAIIDMVNKPSRIFFIQIS